MAIKFICDKCGKEITAENQKVTFSMYPGLPDKVVCKYPCHQEIFEIVQKWLDAPPLPNGYSASSGKPNELGYSGETGVTNA